MAKKVDPDPPAVVRDEDAEATEEKPVASLPRRVITFVGEILLAILVALIITSILRAFVFQIFEVPSGSMENTLQLQDRIIAVRPASFDRGDVVVFKDPDAAWMGPQQGSQNIIRQGLERIWLMPDSTQGYLVKRIIGMPGDHVTCCNANDQIEINGIAIEESEYLFEQDGAQVLPSNSSFDVTVPKYSIFVMGDHRDHSGDSRLHLCQEADPPGAYGFIPFDDVVGPVKQIVWPPARFSGLDRASWSSNIEKNPEPPPPTPILGPGTCDGP